MSDPLWINAGIGDTVGTATIATDGTFTITAHGLVNGQPVRLDTLTGGAVGVFREGVIYFVRDAAADTFALESIPGDVVITLGSSGGADVHTAVPHYSAAELRRAEAGLMFGGTADAFGARQGVRPGHTPVSLSGTTWTVENLTGAVYPALTSSAGPYRVQHEAESGSLDPADGTNPRIDALDLQVQDDDEDASGFRRTRVVYVVGTPASSPVAPAVSATSVRLAEILVPAGGTPAPSLTIVAPFTVASGGVLPVRDDTEAPSAGLYEGMVRYRQDSDVLEAWDGSAWRQIGPGLLDVQEVTTGTAASLQFTVPADVTAARIVGVFRTDAAVVRTNLHVSINGFSSTNAYRGKRLSVSDTATVVDDVRDDAWILGPVVPGGSTGSTEFGSTDMMLPKMPAGTERRRIQALSGQYANTTSADTNTSVMTGRAATTNAITTVTLAPAAGSWVAGTRFELWRP